MISRLKWRNVLYYSNNYCVSIVQLHDNVFVVLALQQRSDFSLNSTIIVEILYLQPMIPPKRYTF